MNTVLQELTTLWHQLMTPEQNAYDCHYYDRNGNHRIFCCYAADVAKARLTLEELVGKDLCRVTGIVKVDGFDW